MKWNEDDLKKAIENHERALEAEPGNQEFLKNLQYLYLALARERMEAGINVRRQRDVFERQQEKKTRK